MIGGERISLQMEIDKEEKEVSIPAVLAALLEHNTHARQQFNELSSEHKVRLIKRIKGADEINEQINISLKMLGGSKT